VIKHGLVAGAVAGVVSGAPSTLHALATQGDPLEATVAAGSILLRNETRRGVLVLAAVPVHAALSLGWGVALAAVLPRRHPELWGAVAGLAIAALDLGVVGRKLPSIAALPVVPQVLDHVAYGVVVGWWLKVAFSRQDRLKVAFSHP
jgi:hypothetical protein